jgi:transposase
MSKSTVFVGMDVHAETIAVAVAEGRNEVRSLGTLTDRKQSGACWVSSASQRT